MSRPQKVYLGMPGYGKMEASASRALWRARRDMRYVHVQYVRGSLLACNFNNLWACALNNARLGDPPAYFAMLHDDVGAEDYWLDTLIEELEQRQLDVVGVALPIKDTKGLTSIAVDNPEGDHWMPRCRLTMTEIHRLPETFTSEDVGAPLLFNTGCWACRFDLETCQKLHFTVNDRIVFNRATGQYMVQVEPEDWFFSRLCHEQKMRVGVTRKVAAVHHGEMQFFNNAAWGTQKHDEEYTERSVLPDVSSDGFRYPYDVDGWLSREEGAALFELAKGKRVLEIGAYCGKSTICLAQSAQSLVSIDPHDGRGTPSPKATLPELTANLARYGLAGAVTVHCGTSMDFLAGANGHCFDMVFIDGAHDRNSVMADVECARRLLADGGQMVFHDYRRQPGEHDGGWDPEVTEVVDGLIEDGAELVSRHKTLAVVKEARQLIGA